MMGGIFTSLDKEQKQAVGLLSIGTFLEYFDLMLYVHMAVLLNELFFPKTDPHTASLLAAFAFCTTYIFRPIGALIFGFIGDYVGRKVTVILTIMFMSLSCVLMANLPTYAQIGIMASWIVTICRIVQGMSSMGELTGAQLYLSEFIKPPARYSAVALLAFASAIGGAASLAVASFVIYFGFNWRVIFGVGAVIALVGAAGRIFLRETPDFTDAKRQVTSMDTEEESGSFVQEKVDYRTSLALFLMDCMWPLCFYFSYMHCGIILKNSFSYSPEQIIHQNFIVSMVQISTYLLFVFLSYKIYPLKILKVKLLISSIIIMSYPYWLDNLQSEFQVLLLQCCIIFFAADASPATSVFYKYFPVLKRFTYISFTYALSRAVVYIITSFGLVYLTEYLGSWGTLIITVPVFTGYILGLWHFEKLEVEQKTDRSI
ncbi:MAG: MFS transporter [Alphaproteobacteria bacterium]|nr:MFS transporter [Alphaproteobacteria bacterium]